MEIRLKRAYDTAARAGEATREIDEAINQIRRLVGVDVPC